MELHSLGVDGGYTQGDVTALSAILTGWTVDRPNQGGPFIFDPKKHEPGPKQWLGHTIASDPGVPPNSPAAAQAATQEGLEALTVLAADSHTAHFIRVCSHYCKDLLLISRQDGDHRRAV
jgi:uncharacterized protein (DUF1800 family)